MSDTNFTLPASIGLKFTDGITINNGTTTVISSESWYKVDDYGAVGDGSTDDTAAIQAAATAAGTNGIVYFTPNKTYIISKQVTLPNDVNLWGYGATIKRADLVSTTLSVSADVGDNSITVADASVFSVGETVTLIDAGSSDAGKNDNDISNWDYLTINDITGNVITFNETVGAPDSGRISTYPIGTPVFVIYDLFRGSSDASNNFYGLTIDGNKASHNLTSSWRTGMTIAQIGEESIVKDCKFINCAGENIFIDRFCTITNNIFQDLDGSGVHISGSGVGTGYHIITNNIFKDCCQVLDSISGHNEGHITFSSNADKIIITNNIFDGSENGIFAPISGQPGSEDTDIIFSNNMCFDSRYITFAESTSAGGVGVYYNYTISNNQFTNCGRIEIGESTDPSSGDYLRTNTGGFRNVKIENNYFVNSTMTFHVVSGLSVKNNEIIFDNNFSETLSAAYKMAIFMHEVENFSIVGNTIYNQKTSYDSNLFTAIGLKQEKLIKDGDPFSDTNYLYTPRHGIISNNKLINWSQFLRNCRSSETPDLNFGAVAIGVKIDNNLMVFREDSNIDVGVYVEGGYIFENNTIYGTSNNVGPYPAIFVLGPLDTDASNYNGGIVRYNTILGCSESAELGRNGVGNVNSRIVFTDNIYTGSIEDNTTSGLNNVNERNTQVIQETYPLKVIAEDAASY